MIDFIGLELIEFHDLPLNNIIIRFASEAKLEIEVSLYDEEIEDYHEIALIFGDLAHLNPQSIPIEDYSDAEIFSFDYHIEGELFHGKMTCLIGFGKPDFEFDFSCKTVEIKEK